MTFHLSSPLARRLAPVPQCALGLLGTLAILLSGCATVKRGWNAAVPRPYVPGNYVAAGPLDASIRRVAILPLYSAEWRASDLQALDEAMATELAKCERFELVDVSRAMLSARFGRGALLSTTALPSDLLPKLGEDTGADAVLLLDLTSYSPYQPISIGVRAKLVAVANGAVLWSFDSVFDAARPEVAEAARRFHTERSRPAYPLEDVSGILQSPARFAKYVAATMFETLPPRAHP